MKEKLRTLITTDLECDDMNSMIHLCLHMDELEIAGIVYTASRYHFNGDGVHTLGEVTPHYSCSGLAALEGRRRGRGPDPEAKDLKEYRPFEEGWIESLFSNEYAAVYPNLCLHSADYPSPGKLLGLVKYGNTAFEGDVRFETEGSRMIEDVMLDDDPRPLYIQSWGGINTVVRALMSVEEKYRGTEEWDDVYNKICRKVRILGMADGVGQDNSWQDHAAAVWKDIVLIRSEFIYGSFFSSLRTQPDSVDTYRAPWLTKNIKFGHGPLLEKTILMGDGTYIKGEPENRQYGKITYIDWGLPKFPRVDFNRYDWLGEGDSTTWVPLLPNGLRGLENGDLGTVLGRLYADGETLSPGDDAQKNPNPFLAAFQSEWAARADWCVRPYEECAHPPVVRAQSDEISAHPGQTVQLCVSAEDADGSGLKTVWFVYTAAGRYRGRARNLRPFSLTEPVTSFCVPEDAVPGDRFVLCLAAETVKKPSIVRYAEICVTVE